MHRVLFIAISVLATKPVDAGRRLRADRFVEPLRLTFLDGDEQAPVRQGFQDAAIDVGRVSGTTAKCTPRGCIVRRRFRVRVDGRTSARFVTLRAHVSDDTSVQRVRLDGRLLSSTPTLVDPAVPVGVATAHTLEIEVSSSEPEGLLAQTIEWTVEDM